MDGTLLNKKYKIVERLTALEEGGGYELPIASASTLGGVKIGENLEISENGVLSASAGVVDYSTNEQATGQKWIDGKDIYFKTEVLENTIQLNPSSWTTVLQASYMNKLLTVMTVGEDGTVSDGRIRWHLENGEVQAASYEILNLVNPTITLYYTKNEAANTRKKTSKKVEN